MRLSATEVRASHEEALALLDALDRVEQLRLAYDVEALDGIVPWLERARDAATRGAPAKELERIRDGLETAIAEAAAVRADQLVNEHAAEIDAMITRWPVVQDRSELVVVLVDPRSPNVPTELCARRWPLSVETAGSLARDIRETLPATAEWLSAPCEPDEHRMIAFTLGRIMRTTRRIPSYADA